MADKMVQMTESSYERFEANTDFALDIYGIIL